MMALISYPEDGLTITAGILTIFFGIATAFLPTVLLVFPAISLGLLTAVAGADKLLRLLKQQEGQRSGTTLMDGLAAVTIGIGMVYGSIRPLPWNILPFVFAALMMVCGILRVDSAYAHQRQGGSWKWTVALGISQAVLGFLLLVSPLVSPQLGTYVFALLLVAYGAGNVIPAVCAAEKGTACKMQLKKACASGAGLS